MKLLTNIASFCFLFAFTKGTLPLSITCGIISYWIDGLIEKIKEPVK